MAPNNRTTHQPDVHALAQSIFDYITRGLRPQLNDAEGGGSANEQAMLRTRDAFADPSGRRAALIAMLADHERTGLWCVAGRCEQGVGTPHVEFHLAVFSALLLDAVRRGDAEIVGYCQRLFAGLYAIWLSGSTSKGWLIWPGARQSEAGPHSVAQDACCGIVGGRVKASPFRNFGRDTFMPWALLEALKRKPDLFAEARTWTAATAPTHWYATRWPVTFEPHDGGLRSTITVPAEDAPQMGHIGSGGVGTTETRVDASGLVSWLIPGPSPVWMAARQGEVPQRLAAPAELGARLGVVTAVAR